MTFHMNSTGGLGNQLFQIAALIDSAERLNTCKHIRFKSTGHTTRQFESEVLLKTLEISLCSFRCKFNVFGKRYIQQESDFEIFRALPDSSRLSGYFQNAEYGVQGRQRILDAIKLNIEHCCKPVLPPRASSVAIHIRLGDYLLDSTNFMIHGVLSENYFKSAIQLLQSSLEVKSVYVFSDTPEVAREKIERIASRIDSGIQLEAGLCKNQNLLCEMYQLGNFDNLVMSNSSFSWWAAAMRKRNHTIGPVRWYREESRRHMNPMINDWHQISNEFEGERPIDV
jgi:hypothetical protein